MGFVKVSALSHLGLHSIVAARYCRVSIAYHTERFADPIHRLAFLEKWARAIVSALLGVGCYDAVVASGGSLRILLIPFRTPFVQWTTCSKVPFARTSGLSVAVPRWPMGDPVVPSCGASFHETHLVLRFTKPSQAITAFGCVLDNGSPGRWRRRRPAAPTSPRSRRSETPRRPRRATPPSC